MKYDVVIASDDWRYWAMWAGTLVGGTALLAGFRRIPEERKPAALQALGVTLLAANALNPLASLFGSALEMSWHRSLPLHFCTLNFLLLALNCFWRNERVFVYTAFLGIIGGVHAFITPQFPMGDSPVMVVDYALRHGAIVFVPLLMAREYGMRFPRRAWVWTYGMAALVSTIVGGVNWAINTIDPQEVVANYMYMWEAPKVDNPLVQAGWGWPLYLLPLHAALIVHLLLIEWLFKRARLHESTS
ncbi:MAG: hypothetical protein RJA19_1904 [Bacteroidota bacterium]|jgi:hypothetical integral membrane protein (TIGR02206 family)